MTQATTWIDPSHADLADTLTNSTEAYQAAIREEHQVRPEMADNHPVRLAAMTKVVETGLASIAATEAVLPHLQGPNAASNRTSMVRVLELTRRRVALRQLILDFHRQA